MSHCFTFRDKALIDRYLCTKPHTNGHYEGCFFCNIVVEIRIYLPHLNSLCCLRFDNNLLAENECPWYTYLFQKYHQSFKIIKNISVEFLRPKLCFVQYNRVPIFIRWNKQNSFSCLYMPFGGSLVPHFPSTVCLFNDAIRLEFPKRIIMLTKQKSLIVQTMNQDYCMQWFFETSFKKSENYIRKIRRFLNARLLAMAPCAL